MIDPLYILPTAVVGSSTSLVLVMLYAMREARKFFKANAVTVVSSSGMDTKALAVDAARKGVVGEARIHLREKYATDACAYAEQVGGIPSAKLEHALDYFRKVDASDNGVRDFSDTEIRLAVEAHLGK